MNPAKVVRDHVHRLTDLPNIGPAMAKDLELIGINRPDQLTGQDPLRLYERLCLERGVRQDPLRAGYVHLHHAFHEWRRSPALVGITE